jgi:hypothetical protein
LIKLSIYVTARINGEKLENESFDVMMYFIVFMQRFEFSSSHKNIVGQA